MTRCERVTEALRELLKAHDAKMGPKAMRLRVELAKDALRESPWRI
jgi:hypothetical protein